MDGLNRPEAECCRKKFRTKLRALLPPFFRTLEASKPVFVGNSCYKMYRFETKGVKKTKTARSAQGLGVSVRGPEARQGRGGERVSGKGGGFSNSTDIRMTDIAFLLGNSPGGLYRFDAEGVKKTKCAERAGAGIGIQGPGNKNRVAEHNYTPLAGSEVNCYDKRLLEMTLGEDRFEQ